MDPCHSSEVRVAQIDVAVAQVFLVHLVFGALGLSLALEEDESIAGGAALVEVNGDITLSDAEINEEIADLASTSGEGQSTHFQALVAVVSVDEVGETDSLTAAIATTIAATITRTITGTTAITALNAITTTITAISAITTTTAI